MDDLIKLGASEKRVLEALDNYWVSPFKRLSERTGLATHIVKRATRSLAKKGFASLETAFNEDDGAIAGKGYTLTPSSLASPM